MKKAMLERKFIHHSWFKEGRTRAYALDYFAKSLDFELVELTEKDIITDGCFSYKLNEEEKQYYLERRDYWKKVNDLKNEEWLNADIDFDIKLKKFLCGYSPYDVEGAEKELEGWKNQPDAEFCKDSILYWTNKLARTNKCKADIDKFILEEKQNVKTNADFIKFVQGIRKITESFYN